MRCSAVVAAGMVGVVAAAAGAAGGPPRFRGRTRVVASRVAGDAGEVGRREVVLTREEIRRLPARTLADLLALLPGVGLRRRGPLGAQADLGLRGGTFEQTAVLLDGVRVGNRQTGHFALDLFLPVEAIERIEVLYGPGTAASGPGAFGGAVNVVTGVRGPAGHAAAGQHGLVGLAAALPLGGGAWAAVERLAHTGFRDDTELELVQGAAGWVGGPPGRRLRVTVSAGSRAAGAWSFYTPRFPWQRETTGGTVAVASAELEAGPVTVRPYVRGSRHRDRFVLDRRRPAWYANRHTTREALAGVEVRGGSALRWAVGTEWERDAIRSSSLGRHHRVRAAVFAEAVRRWRRGALGAQLRADRESPWGRAVTGGVGGSWRVGATRVRAAWGSAFRSPSFTELHYRSPASVGDPYLRPERGRTAEVGLDVGAWSVTLFRRHTGDLIDWVLGEDGAWHATNLGSVTTRGLELAALLPAPGRLRWQRLGLAWLASDARVDPARSRYALTHPRLEAAWTGAAELGRGLEAGWALRLRDPRDAGAWAVLDASLGARILPGTRVVVEVANVLDREVEEVRGVPLPGRWAVVRLEWEGS